MAVGSGGRTLKRLARLRELEEEQSRLELELAARRRAEVAENVNAAVAAQATGRRSFVSGVVQGDGLERVAGLAAMRQAEGRRTALMPHLAEADRQLAVERDEYLARRTERRQVDTLLAEQRAEEQREAAHRAQQMLDDWYGRKRKPAEAR